MEPRISFAVQAHPQRALLAHALAQKLGGEAVFDPDPENAIRSPWRTFRHLMETTPPGATHRFQIQDDARVCPGLPEAMQNLVRAWPDRLLVLFVGGNPPHHARQVLEACREDRSVVNLVPAYWLPVVATCWPVEMTRELLAFVDAQRWPERFCADDEICGRFIKEAQVTALGTVPSLVQHEDVIPSLAGRRTAGGADLGRIAACWIGDCDECTDAREIDWTRI